MSAQDLIVYKKTEDLFYKVYPTYRNFPKSEQHSMCRFLKGNFTELLTCLSLANSVKSKRKTYLQEADARLTSLTNRSISLTGSFSSFVNPRYTQSLL